MSDQAGSSNPTYRNPLTGLFAPSICAALLALSGCSGNNNNNDGPAAAEATISGKLLVPPNHELEVEPNNSPDQAQDIGRAARVSGNASAADAGYPLPGTSAVVTDLYKVTITVPARATLTIGANDLVTFDPATDTITEIITDLDLAVFDDQGNLVAFSEGLVPTESIDIDIPGDYFIGVRAAVGSSPYVVSVTPLGLLGGSSAAWNGGAPVVNTDFVPGEILVKSRLPEDDSYKARRALAQKHGASYRRTQPPGIDIIQISRPTSAANLKGQPTPWKIDLAAFEDNLHRAATLEAIKRLESDPDVEWAEPNYMRRPQLVPDDELYFRQWHYEQIKLPDAWDTTRGSDAIIVAVLDTGILSGHPDLAGRLIPGYDFVSSVFRAQDGDGIDPDAEDPGDDPRNQNSSFHGTHTAGTVGAASNNSIGVSGVTWQTRIMPVRVLGALGGTSSEVADGIRYAAGLPNSSDTVPPEPARIISMSLGGAGTSAIEQQAITAAREAGLVVIASAGNDNSSDTYSPAGLDGVISVSAVNPLGQKASYSNYGPTVDVAAPGGEFWDSDDDDLLDAVLSTLGNDRGIFYYRYYQGTSMAAPHVSGVIALMLAVNPNLTPEDIDMLLAGTHPDTSTPITMDLGIPGRDDRYGYGLIDAAGAVRAASEVVCCGPPLGPTGSRAQAFPLTLDFSNFQNVLQIVVSNGGIGDLGVDSASTDAPWLMATLSEGDASSRIIEVRVDRSGLDEGLYNGIVTVETDATQGPSSIDIPVAMRVGGVSSGDAGPVTVRVLTQDGSQVVAEVITDATQDYAYTTPGVPPGTYLVTAGTDRDGDTVICDVEDACGAWLEDVTVDTSGTDVTDVDILITFGVGTEPPPILPEAP